MSDESHDIPDHLIPTEKTVLASSEEEKELNEQLGTERWVYTEEPDNNVCPYCGKSYNWASFAGNVSSAGKGVCPYPVEKYGDFIIEFVHSVNRTVRKWENGKPVYGNGGSVQSYCSPEHEETLVGIGTRKDWDLTNI